MQGCGASRGAAPGSSLTDGTEQWMYTPVLGRDLATPVWARTTTTTRSSHSNARLLVIEYC